MKQTATILLLLISFMCHSQGSKNIVGLAGTGGSDGVPQDTVGFYIPKTSSNGESFLGIAEHTHIDTVRGLYVEVFDWDAPVLDIKVGYRITSYSVLGNGIFSAETYKYLDRDKFPVPGQIIMFFEKPVSTF